MKIAKKGLCLFIAVLMIIPMGIMSAFAAEPCDCEYAPYVFIVGRTPIYVTKEDGTRYAPLLNDTYDVAQISKKVLPLLLTALRTGDWTDYGNALYECIAPTYEEIKANPDGTVPENTAVESPWSYDKIHSEHAGSMQYVNYYYPDHRLPLMDVADDIQAFIEAVKQKTGHDKVNLIGRCLGGNHVMAYLAKYGWDSVNRVAFVTSCHNGTSSVDALLSGNMRFDSDCVARLVKSDSSISDSVVDSGLMSYLLLTFDMLRETYTDTVAIMIVEKLYEKLKDTTFASLIRNYYAFGGGLANVNEHFEEAIEYLYPTQELKDEYAVVIEKARTFHYDVQLKAGEILKKMEAEGVPVFSFVEYGAQQYPTAGKESAKTGDHIVGAQEQSSGATVSDVDKTLSQEYIDSRIAAGYGNYISPDKQIDASTCLFPDRTWFAKGLNHGYPAAVDQLLDFLMYTENAPTVTSSEKYPQFMLYSNGSLVKLDENNGNIIDWDALETTTGQTEKFFTTIVNLFKNFLNGFLDKIFEFVDKIKGVPHVKRDIL